MWTCQAKNTLHVWVTCACSLICKQRLLYPTDRGEAPSGGICTTVLIYTCTTTSSINTDRMEGNLRKTETVL